MRLTSGTTRVGARLRPLAPLLTANPVAAPYRKTFSVSKVEAASRRFVLARCGEEKAARRRFYFRAIEPLCLRNELE